MKYFYLMMPVFITESVLYYAFDQISLTYYLLIPFFLIGYTLLIIPKNFNIKKLVFSWFIIGPLYISFFIIILWKFSLISFLWILPLPLGAYIFFSFKTVLYYILYVIGYIAAIIFVSSFIDTSQYFHFTQNQIKIIDILVVIYSLLLISLTIYYMNKINITKYKITNNDNLKQFVPPEISKDEIVKYNDLFSKITEYMSEKEPFKKSDFTISKLSFILNSNHSYISKAIKFNGFSNFNNFLNTYRVNYVKKQLKNNDHNQFTLHYIYTEAGFIHQSTFNRVFKEIEGVTPTQYISELKKENS